MKKEFDFRYETKYFTEEEIRIINSSYGTAIALKQVLLNMFNEQDYPNVYLRKCLMSDENHLKIFYKILNMPLSYINGKQIIKDFIVSQ